jgi:hypothetical protein
MRRGVAGHARLVSTAAELSVCDAGSESKMR